MRVQYRDIAQALPRYSTSAVDRDKNARHLRECPLLVILAARNYAFPTSNCESYYGTCLGSPGFWLHTHYTC